MIYFDGPLDFVFLNIVYFLIGNKEETLLDPAEHVNLLDFVRKKKGLYLIRNEVILHEPMTYRNFGFAVKPK